MKTIVNLGTITYSYNSKTKTFLVSERDLKFDTTYLIFNPKTQNSVEVIFSHSTGPEFSSETSFIYKSETGIVLEVSNDSKMTQKAAKAYLAAKTTLQVKEELLYPKYVSTDNGEGQEIYSLFKEYSHSKKVGDVTISYAGAPGIGHVKHQITKITDQGIYRIVLEDTMRIPDISYYM